MKNYEQMAQSVLQRRDRYVKQRKEKTKKLTVTVSAVGVCSLACLGAWRLIPGSHPTYDIPLSTQAGTAASDPTEFSQRIEAAEPIQESRPGISIDEELCVSPSYTATALTEAQLYEEVGAYLPTERPAGFSFESASHSPYGYRVIWYHGLEELDWYVRDYQEADAACMTDAADTENYDLSLYPIPRAESVPEHLMQIVDCPIFRAEELTLDVVYARAYTVDEIGDTDGYRMHFSVLYGSKVVTVTAKGVSPQWVYEQLKRILKS